MGKDFTQYVDPLIGTGDHGHTFPGAVSPFGLIQLSPDNGQNGWDFSSGYNYKSDQIEGFSHLHLSGTGVGDLLDILLVPNGVKHKFKHQDENAKPGYYQVKMSNNDKNVDVTLMATQTVGLHEYKFSDINPLIKIDLKSIHNTDKHVGSQINQINSTTIYGFRKSKGWAPDQHVYFAIVSNIPITMDGTNIKFINQTIKLQVSVSPISSEHAHQHILDENLGWDYKKIYKKIKKEWNKVLSPIIIEGTKDQKVIFYTSLYHASIHPSSMGDGTYSTLSTWDTFRSWAPLMGLINHNIYDKTIDTILNFAEQKHMPIWTLWGQETGCMPAMHSISLLGTAYAMNVTMDINKVNMLIDKNFDSGFRHFKVLDQKKYIPIETSASVSDTLELCINLRAMSLMSVERKNKYYDLSQSYLNLWDPQVKYFRGKHQNGNFRQQFNPDIIEGGCGKDYVEGCAKDIQWLAPNIKHLLGDEFETRLDKYFSEPRKHKIQDITGLIGSYPHGNENAHHVSFLYNSIGKYNKTNNIITKIRNLYTSQPNGIPGNEDCGQMSAWYILSSLGFHPIDTFGQDWQLVYPLYDKSFIHLSNKNTLHIQVVSTNNYLVEHIIGKQLFVYVNMSIPLQNLLKGGKLIYY